MKKIFNPISATALIFLFSGCFMFDSLDIQLQSISITPSETVTIHVGSTAKLGITVKPFYYPEKSVTWVSSNPDCATVNPSGVVTGISPGHVIITATTTDGSRKSASRSVVVKDVYTVTFESNGGSDITSLSVPEGEQATEPTPPTKANNLFDGWFTNNTFVTPVVFPYTVAADVTFYAKWIAIYNVTFESNGGSSITAQSVIEGGLATEPATPTKADYTFAGWFTDELLLSAAVFPFPVNADITLYAKWNLTMTLLFDEDFEGFPVGTSPTAAGWTQVYPGSGTRQVMEEGGNRYLRLSGTNSGHAQFEKSLPAVLPNIITYEATMRPVTNSSNDIGSIALGDKTKYTWGAYCARVEFIGGKIVAYNYGIGSGTQYELATYTLNQWYHIKMACNFTTLTFQVFVDGTLMTSTTGGILTDEFPMLADVPTGIQIISGSSIDFDDIKVYY